MFLNGTARTHHTRSLWKRLFCVFWLQFYLLTGRCFSFQSPLFRTLGPWPVTTAKALTPASGRGRSPLPPPLKPRTVLPTSVRSVCPRSPQTLTCSRWADSLTSTACVHMAEISSRPAGECATQSQLWLNRNLPSLRSDLPHLPWD